MSEEWQFHGYTLREIYNSLGFSCQATLTNGKTFSGRLYNVDPETFTLLILQLPLTQEQKQEQSAKRSSEDRDTTVEANEQESGGSEVTKRVEQQQQQQQRQHPFPETTKKPQDQGPTQARTQAQAQASLPTSQSTSNLTPVTNASTQRERPTMVAIRQHALKTLSIDTLAIEGSGLTTETMEALAGLPAPRNISPVDIMSRKQSIVTMLDSQRIPWKTTGGEEGKEEAGVIQLPVGGARIKPPYITSSVDCPNKVILERVQGMIREHDFNNKKIIASPFS